jgi:hypothetical protein
MAAYVPPGWPEAVHPPGSEDFEQTAMTWLLDIVQPEYRSYGILRRHPAALASMARYHTRACLEGARQSYRAARSELARSVPPHAADGMLAALRTEGFKLADTACAVELVGQALRGEAFAPVSGDGIHANGLYPQTRKFRRTAKERNGSIVMTFRVNALPEPDRAA